MKMRTTTLLASGLLASRATAQVASVCPETNVCFKLNIPEKTASSGSGDVFFQISAPSTYQWAALGQGRAMSGSNIFAVYTSGDGKNVTLSPRLGTGYSMPSFNSEAQVELLEGSGVANGVMVANVKCSNCNSWSGGTADFTAGSGEWIYAYQSSGGPMDSDDKSATIRQHGSKAAFSWNYASAKGGSSVNPLVNAAPAGTATGGSGQATCIPRQAQPGTGASATQTAASPTQTGSGDDDDNWGPWSRPTSRPGRPPADDDLRKRQDLPYCDDSGGDSSNAGFSPIRSGVSGDRKMMLIAHGVLAGLAFVILFPAGAIAIRLASFPGVVWLHAAFQVFAYLIYTAAFGIGVYMAREMHLLEHHHPVIGIVVFAALMLQPVFGLLHHILFKKHGSRTLWSYVHIWLGRAAVTLGIINGGLGLRLADSMNMSSKSGIIAYGVVAALMWLTWVAASIVGERRRKGRMQAQTKYEGRTDSDTDAPLNEGRHGRRV